MSFLCAILLCCAFIAPKFANAAALDNINNSDKTLKIDELTISGYDSSKTNAQVFNGNNLAKLYRALTGGNGSTIEDVKETISGEKITYGLAKQTEIPNYKNAEWFYRNNDNKNIVVNFGGQEWAVTFLTTDKNGEVIATLWMTQPLKNNDGTVFKTNYGWETKYVTANIPSTTTTTIISSAYSTSTARVVGVNGGSATSTDGILYNTSATATTPVSLAQRQAHPLAKFTLANSLLTDTANANKSLINYITQPFDVDYTYVLDICYEFGRSASNSSSYVINEALTRDAQGNAITDKLSQAVGSSGTTFWANTTLNNAWFNQGVYNYAYGENNRYNEWGSDYVWLPTLSETGVEAVGGNEVVNGFWSTGGGITNLLKFNNGDKASGSGVLSANTDSDEYVYLRNGDTSDPYGNNFIASNGSSSTSYNKAKLAIRPALHLNLTKADAAGKTQTKPNANTDSNFTYDAEEHTYLPANFNADTMEITGNVQTDAGDYTASVTPKAGYTWTDGTVNPVTFNYKINKATPTVTPVFSGGTPFNTDGFPEPTSYTAGANGVEITGTFSWINQTIECGKSKEYEWTFTPNDDFANNFTTVTGKQPFNFQERKIDSMEVSFDAGGKTVYTKTPESELMKMITLTVHYNDGKVVEEKNFEIECALVEGEGNEIAVIFGNQLPKMVAVNVYVQLAKVTDLTVLFKQNGAIITPNTPLDDLKQYLSVYPTWNYTTESNKLADGDYELSGSLSVGTPAITVKYEGVGKTFTPTVSKDSYNFTPVFEDKIIGKGQTFDELSKNWITGLPNGVTVEYTCEDCDLSGELAVGSHTITAHFNGDYDNYEVIPDKTATLTVENNYQTPGFAQDVLDYDPAGNAFELLNFDGIKDIAELTCKGAPVSLENALNKTEIGDFELTITLTEGKFLGDKQSVTLYYSIVKCKVNAPEFVASLVYSGNTLTPKAADFEFDGGVVGFVSAESGINAGSYTAVFELLDTDHYEWASKPVRKVPAKYALTEGEELADNQIQVYWTIAKATVSATVEEGKMPVFTCATVGNLDGYVSYTYFKDELCTEQIAFGELAPDTRYYVKATFTDTDGNFELDESATAVINGRATAYDTSPKEPTFIQKAFAFVKQNWLWFAIGGGVLLFLILLIIIIAATHKKRKARAEERKAEKKEEERQRRAEEREERMMRMQSMQSMPITAAGMIAAQQQQQAMPAPVQQPVQQTPVQQPVSYAAPAADSSALAEIKAELAELKAKINTPTADNSAMAMMEMKMQMQMAELKNAQALAEIKTAQAIADDRRTRGGADNSIPAEVVVALLKAVQSGNIAPVNLNVAPAPAPVAEVPQISEESVSSSAMYPPDAVITTTTTVDTTKKGEDKPVRIKRDESRERSSGSEFSDLDGFYDSYNE